MIMGHTYPPSARWIAPMTGGLAYTPVAVLLAQALLSHKYPVLALYSHFNYIFASACAPDCVILLFQPYILIVNVTIVQQTIASAYPVMTRQVVFYNFHMNAPFGHAPFKCTGSHSWVA